MKKYNTVFSSFHNIYRLITASTDFQNFIVGVCRVYRNSFKACYANIICKNIESAGLLTVKIEKNNKQIIKKGNFSKLTEKETNLLKQGKEILTQRKMVYPFTFSQSLGVISIKRNPENEVFTESDHKWFLSLSEEISICLKIFILNREGKRLLFSYLDSLTNLLDQYVPTSYLNPKSTMRLLKAIGKEMKLSQIETQSLEYAALLHDAGKIKIPSQLLTKRNPLTEDEFKLIMKHPRGGVKLIKDLEALKPVIPIILHHHERFDGSGYPSKLKKEKIPLGSRILAVLDAFDAMYFGRPYKNSKSLNDIKKELKTQMDSQFDPKVITAFLKILKHKDIQKFLKNCH